MAPGPLAQVLCQLPQFNDPDLLTRDIPFADAGIYRIAEDLALVQSVDFFTPIVDDPDVFGRIAAANALSDIYAVGGRPVTALNLVGFPKDLDHDILAAILTGGAEKVREAKAVIAGGHTVEDDEPKYGLAVTGLVDPRRMLTTVGARPGDVLVLTKPLGTGILATALKGDVLGEGDLAEALAGMQALNRGASKAMLEIGASACTDITGFGLLGHASELAAASEVCVVLDADTLPVYPQVREMAAMGLIPAGSYRNREFYRSRLKEPDAVSREQLDLLADPQTSGGLLIAVGADKASDLLRELQRRDCRGWCIGRIEPAPAGRVALE